jgi:pSer/pThr/pTyr-binding forkhead associated (FHA) protein
VVESVCVPRNFLCERADNLTIVMCLSMDTDLSQETVAPDFELPVAEDVTDAGAAEQADGGIPLGSLTILRNGQETEEVFAFAAPATLGRFDPSVGPIDVDLGNCAEGVYVSRKHARITCEDGVWKIQDLGSSNGTFVLGSDFERVEEAEITDGTQIALGNARLVFHVTS